MTILIFGSGGDIFLPGLKMSGTSLGSDVHYTSPCYDSCYSKYGFAVPTNYEAIPYNVIMENMLPKLSDTVARFESTSDYILVDHSGNVWHTSLHLKNDGNLLSQSFITADGSNGWWLNVNKLNLHGDERPLLGFLNTNPNLDQINSYFHTYHTGSTVVKLSIKDIVETLNASFPIGDKVVDDADPKKGD